MADKTREQYEAIRDLNKEILTAGRRMARAKDKADEAEAEYTRLLALMAKMIEEQRDPTSCEVTVSQPGA